MEDCCKDTIGRVLGVSEELAGSWLDADYLAPGVLGIIGTGSLSDGGTGFASFDVTIDTDARGDSILLAGGGTAGHVPNAITDSKGNTYFLDVGRTDHAASGPDAYTTFGLDGSVWFAHGVFDVAKLEIGDTVTITYDGTLTHDEDAMVFDVVGIGDEGSYDSATRGSGFNFADTFSVSGGTPTEDGELYVAVGNGRQGGPGVSGIDPIGSAGVSDYGTTACAVMLEGTEVPNVVMTAPRGGDPPPPYPSWSEGVAAGYRVRSTARVLSLVDVSEFNSEGGSAQVIDPDTGDITLIEYTAIDEDDDQLLGVTGAETLSEGSQVVALPRSVFRYADAQVDGEDDLIRARIPHYLFDRIPMRTADVNSDEAFTVMLALKEDGWVIVDIYGEEPVVDGSFIDPTTLPRPSDGFVPGESPDPELTPGPTHFKARWDAVELNSEGDEQLDLVLYDLHVETGVPEVAASLTIGTGDGTWFLEAVTPGAAGDDITITVAHG